MTKETIGGPNPSISQSRVIMEHRNTCEESCQSNHLYFWCPMGKAGVSRRTVAAHHHKWIQAIDSSTQDLFIHMSNTCDFIDKLASPAPSSLSSLSIDNKPVTDDKPETILVHYDLSISHSPTIIIAYPMRKLRIPPIDASEFVKSKRSVRPSAKFTRQLQV